MRAARKFLQRKTFTTHQTLNMSDSDSELEQLLSDSDSDFENSLCGSDVDYIPTGMDPGTAWKDITDNSDEECESSPTKRSTPRKRCRSISTSPRSTPQKSTPKKQRGCSKELHDSPTKTTKQNNTQKRSSFHQTGGMASTSRRKNGGRKIQTENEEEGEGNDGDRWQNMEEEDVDPPQPVFRPERESGPQLNRTAKYTPLELFQLFFSTTVVDTLVKNSNTYGKSKKTGNKKNNGPVTTADFYSYLSLVLYMGIVPLKCVKDYWRGAPLYRLPFPASVMTHTRFAFISGCLHLNDPEVEAANDQKKGTPEYDRLCKIRPLYDQIMEGCHTFFHPYQHISIDERMVASKARIGLKQYIKNKPTKWGFKLFVLADSLCGYTVNFYVYSGKEGKPSGKGHAYDVVMRLLNIPFLGRGYKLYVDNYYTSPTLFIDLLKRKTFACGTIRSNLLGYPHQKKNDITNKMPRGTLRWIRNGQLVFVKWLDARVVSMCSTLHKASSNEMVKRKTKDTDGKWIEKAVPIPACIKDYNKYMGGVDLSDALLSYYSVAHKTLKWYKTLFYHFVDIATVNAFILHKELCKLQNQPMLTQKAFREQLIWSLAELGVSSRATASPVKSIGPSLPSALLHAKDKRLEHLPTYFVEHMTNVSPSRRGTVGRRSCVLCKRKSPVFCSTCEKALCLNTLRNCYSEWHKSNVCE